MKIEPYSDAITDFKVEFPGVLIGVKEIDLIQGIVYLWAVVTDPPVLSVYREMRQMLTLAKGARVVINVDATEPKALRFAQFFGFRITNRVVNTYIMELS